MTLIQAPTSPSYQHIIRLDDLKFSTGSTHEARSGPAYTFTFWG